MVSVSATAAAGTFPFTIQAVGDTTETSNGTLIIGQANQTITFGSLSDKSLGDPDFTISASSDSTLPVTFSTSSSACSVSGNTVHLLAAGSCTITASQVGNTNYNSASAVNQTFNVAAGASTLTTTPTLTTYTISNHTITPTTPSTTINVVFSEAVSNPTVEIDDPDGNLVTSWNFVGSSTTPASSMVWDGSDSHFSSGVGPDGVYTVHVSDSAGFHDDSQTITLDNANTTPTLITYTISNPKFSPNGDGIKDSTTINVVFSEPVPYPSIEIDDAHGNPVAGAGFAGFSTSPNGPMVWNGVDEDNTGVTVPDGIYTVQVYDQPGLSGFPNFLDRSQTITVDNTAPVITLTGSTTVNLTAGQSYTDAGATALDNIDGDITSNIVKTGTVDTSTPGTYTLHYNVSDAAGNPATEVTRTVNVAAAPIPLSSAKDITAFSFPQGTGVISGTDIAVTVPFRTDVTALVPTITTTGVSVTPDTSIVQDFTNPVQYTVTAADSSTQVYTVTVTVAPAATPTLTTYTISNDHISPNADGIKDTTNINVVFSEPVPSPNIDIVDAHGNAVWTGGVAGFSATAGIVWNGIDEINSGVTVPDGVYTIQVYDQPSFSGFPSFLDTSKTITVDTTAPVITLLGSPTVNLSVGDSYKDAGATALDNIDGDITNNIVTTGSVDTSNPGTYTLHYNVSDDAGNPATEVTRTVNVAAAPAATLTSIAITSPANKLSYTIADSLDISGLVVTGTYSDASTAVEPIAISDVSGFNSSTPVTGQVLTITFDGQTTTYNVNINSVVVTPPTPSTDDTLSNLTVNGTTVSGFDRATSTYNVVLPFGTTTLPTVTATSNDVNANKVITQTSALPGSATVSVTAQDGTINQIYTVNFTVATATAIPVTSISVLDASLASSETLAIGATDQLTATIAPADASNQAVSWSSSDSTIASVDPSTGLVTAVSAGTATITATASDTTDGTITASFEAVVSAPVASVSGGGGGGTSGASTITTTTNTNSVLGGADLNNDGKVDIEDYVILMANWGQTGNNIADLNHDGIVNISDLVILMANWTV